MKLTLVSVIVFLGIIALVSSHAYKGGEPGNKFLEKLSSILRKATLDDFPILNNEDDPLFTNILHIWFPNLTTIDPWTLEDGTTNYDSLLLAGHTTITDNVVTGFSTITDALWADLSAGAPDFTFRVDLPSLHIEGGYDSGLSILQNWLHFSGSGHHSIDLEHFFVDLGIGLLATEIPTLEITRLDVDAGFQRLELQFENSELNCSPADWDEINKEIRIIFDIYWPVVRDRVMPAIQGILNELIKDCNLNDLIEGNFDCITGGNPEPIPELIVGYILRSLLPRLPTGVGKEYVNPCATDPITTSPPDTTSTPGETPSSTTPPGLDDPSGGPSSHHSSPLILFCFILWQLLHGF